MSTPSTPYAVGPDGELYVNLSTTGISMLCVLTDALTVTVFKEDGEPLLRLSDAIAWHQREAAAGDDMSRRAAEAMVQAREKLRVLLEQSPARRKPPEIRPTTRCC